MLEERLAGDFASLRVPYSKLDADEFCRWALAALGEAPAADPEQALAARIARGAAIGRSAAGLADRRRRLLPIPTLLTLLGCSAAPATRCGSCSCAPASCRARRVRAGGRVPVNIALEGEMGSAEMAHYVRARLDRAGADPAERAQLEAALDRLYARSRGNPGRLHAAAAALLCFGPDRLSAPAAEPEPAPPAEAERGDPRRRGDRGECAALPRRSRSRGRIGHSGARLDRVARRRGRGLGASRGDRGPGAARGAQTALVAPAEPPRPDCAREHAAAGRTPRIRLRGSGFACAGSAGADPRSPGAPCNNVHRRRRSAPRCVEIAGTNREVGLAGG